MISNVKSIRRENLRHLIKLHGGNSALAKKVATTPSYLSQIMSEKTRGEVGDRFARQIEEALGLDLGWMSTDHAAKAVAVAGVPVATEGDVREIVAGARAVPREDHDIVQTSRGVSDRAFGYVMRGDDMQPLIPLGSVLIVEPDAKPEPGHVCVYVNESGVFIRQAARLPDGTMMLKPANERYPVTVAAPGTVFVGVVKQAIKDLA